MFSSNSNISARYLLLCFFSINEASAISSAIFSVSLTTLSPADDFDDNFHLVPDDLSELLDFAEDLDEGLLFSLFTLTQL